MAEEHDVERELPATPRRLEEAREKGQVARSRELAAAASVLAAAMAFAWLGPRAFDRCADLVRTGLTLDRDEALATPRMLERLGTFSVDALVAFLPLLAVLLAATVAAPLLLSGGIFSWHVLKPDFNRMNPARGLSNMFSSQGLVELVKAILKCVLLGAIATWALMHYWEGMQSLPLLSAPSAAQVVGGELQGTFVALALGLGVIAAIDVPWQLWQHLKQLRMTREEVKEEMRESDGDPQQKARIRQVQRAMARKRMMAAVPTADVIVANPEHYAVALAYKEGGMRAPQVVAKGVDEIAQRIKALGAQHGVPILEAPPLARALFRHTEIGADIPVALFAAVAQVLAYVHQVQQFRTRGGRPPVEPTDLPVPPELDPLHEGAAA
ncbi:MAG: flagellar biosynthesis protein FlhB [Burkholderiales bacterium]